MGLRNLTLIELWGAWTFAWSLSLGIVVYPRAPRDLLSRLKWLAVAGGAAPVLGAVFAFPMWLLIKYA